MHSTAALLTISKQTRTPRIFIDPVKTVPGELVLSVGGVSLRAKGGSVMTRLNLPTEALNALRGLRRVEVVEIDHRGPLRANMCELVAA